MCVLKQVPRHPTGTFEAHDSAKFKEEVQCVRFAGLAWNENLNLLRLLCDFYPDVTAGARSENWTILSKKKSNPVSKIPFQMGPESVHFRLYPSKLL